MKDKVILVTGATGLLGPYIMDGVKGLGRVVGLARKGAQVILDITDRDAVAKKIESLSPHIVIHAAALTDVDTCEKDPEAAFLLNRDATGFIAESLLPSSRLVYISTDQVYPDGEGPHTEGTEDPVNVYGKSKFEGEVRALSHSGTLVLRTNIFGKSRTPGRASLSDFVIESLSQGKHIQLFEDIFFSPLSMETACKIIFDAVERGLTGIYNMGSREGMSKKDFAMMVAARKGLSTRTTRPVKSASNPGRAPRPRDMRLNVSRLELALERKMPTLEEEIGSL